MKNHKPTSALSDSIFSRPIDRRGLLRGSAVTVGGLAGLSIMGSPLPAVADTPRRGGNLRVAILGGSSADTLDAHGEVTQADVTRAQWLYEPLVELDRDGQLVNVLAESFEPNATATEWTIRLRKGVLFHDGRSVTAKDLAATFRRIANPKAPMAGATSLKAVDLDGLKVMDDLTLRVPLHSPFAALVECISASFNFGVVPSDYDPKNPVGTGPLKFQSFAPGQQSVFSRFDGYWKSGRPYLDAVTLIDFPADTAAFNALQGGEIDAFLFAPLALINQAGGEIQAVASRPGQWTPFTMRVDQAPFNNVDVRQAFRLLVDRQQMINQALSGHGLIGNDVFAWWDPAYDHSLVRARDVDKAKYLLKKAGQENLTVELVTGDIASGVLQAAQVFAQQAKDAGVTVNVRQVTVDVFFGDQYLKWPFAQDFWGYSPYLSQVVQSMQASSPYNETHWNDDRYNKLYSQAQATVDHAKRAEILVDMQKLDFEEGGYIIPSYNQTLDLLRQNVRGVVPTAIGLSGLGNSAISEVWLA